MDNVSSTFKSLYEEKAKMLEVEDYAQAENIRKRIRDYETILVSNHKREMELTQSRDKKEFEEMIQREIAAFDSEWNQRESERRLEFNKQLEEIDDYHRSEIQKIVNDYEANYKEKTPRQYLNLKRIQFELVRQQRYPEATVIKKRAEALLREENEKSLNQWKNEMRTIIDNKVIKQKIDKELAEKDIESKMNLLKTEREKEKNKMIARFNSKKCSLAYHQQIEIKREQTDLKKVIRKKRVHSLASTRNSFNAPLDKSKTTLN